MINNRANRMKLMEWVIVGIVIGICLFVFYTVAHPMYIYDTDDWTYIASHRHAWPSVKEWNPTKILPETLMPLVAEFGIRFIMPLTKDYVGSMAIAFALVTTGFIVAYVLIFGKVMEKLFNLNTAVTFGLIILFLLYHFLPFNVKDVANQYLLWGGNVNCYFNYLLPGLLNAALVMYLMVHKQGNCKNKNRYIYKGLLILTIYLCINSNMFHSIILASFAGVNVLIWALYKIKKYYKEHKIRQFFCDLFKENAFWMAILVVWAGSLCFEMQGGRAARASTGLFHLPIGMTLKKFIASVLSMNKLYLFSMFIVIILGIFVYLIKGKREQKQQDKNYMQGLVKLAVCLIVTWVYLILLCSKVSPEYIMNTLVQFSWMFWFMMIGFLSLSYVLAKVPYAALAVPLCLYVIVFETVIDGHTYAENSVTEFDSATVKALDENIIDQMIAADKAGLTDVTVYIPVHSSKEWPMNVSYGGSRIATTLFRHGIVSRQMNVTLVMEQSVNDKFNLP